MEMKELVPRKLPVGLVINSEGRFLKLYDDDPDALSAKFYGQCVERLQSAFPTLRREWFELLADYLSRDRFSQPRIMDAIDDAIRTQKYPSFAMILSYGLERIPYRMSSAEAIVLKEKYNIDESRFDRHGEEGNYTWSLER